MENILGLVDSYEKQRTNGRIFLICHLDQWPFGYELMMVMFQNPWRMHSFNLEKFRLR